MSCPDHLYRNLSPREVSRRWFLRQCGVGLGAIAFAQLLGERGYGDTATADPLAPKQPQFAPKAKRVIFLFMAGAPSHLELFDYKPQLAKFDGTLPPPELLKGYRAAFINPNSRLLGPKFKFAKYGQCGTELSELLPHLSQGGRRHRHREVDGDRCLQSRARADSDEHRHHAVWPAQHGGVGALRAGLGSEGSARLRGLQLGQKRAERRRIRAGEADSCPPSTRAWSSAAAATRCCTSPTPGVNAAEQRDTR